MKRLITLIALLISFGSMAQIKIPIKSKVTIKYTTVVYEDGTTFLLIGSDTKKRRDSAYLANYKPPVISPVKWVEMGDGKSELKLGVLSDVNIRLKQGNYSGISAEKLTNVIIDANGSTVGSMYFLTLNGFELLNANITGTEGIQIINQSDNVNFHNNTFKNSGGINYKNYDLGKSIGWNVSDNIFENVTGALNTNGGYDKLGVRNLMLGLKFKNNTITKSNTVTYIIATEDAEFSGNKVDNDGRAKTGEIHSGVFFFAGNGKFFNNTIKNYEGNAARIWAMTFGTTPKTIEAYNNIGFNSYKYGGIEVQSPPYMADIIDSNLDKYSYVNVDVHNNTFGQLNTSKAWESSIVDLYNVGFGKKGGGSFVKVYNNLAFDLRGENTTGLSAMVNNFSGYQLDFSTNKYFPTWSEAIQDLNSFKSKISGIGANQ